MVTTDERARLRTELTSLAWGLVLRHGDVGKLPRPLQESPEASAQDLANINLALLHALATAQRELSELLCATAHSAGHTGLVTYADLGRAAGVSKQNANLRWPEAIPNPRPGRPLSSKKRGIHTCVCDSAGSSTAEGAGV